jgi:hypothetical protein
MACVACALVASAYVCVRALSLRGVHHQAQNTLVVARLLFI